MSTQPTPEDLEALLLAQHPASKHYLPAVKAKIVAAMQAAVSKWGTPATGGEPNSAFPITGSIYKRNDEWVLELAGTINDCNFTCRHTQPGHLTPEYVAGLPTLYTSPQSVREPLTPERIEEICLELRDTVGCGNQTLARAIERAHGITGGQHGTE